MTYMTKDVCLKWADNSREVQSVAGGITVQNNLREKKPDLITSLSLAPSFLALTTASGKAPSQARGTFGDNRNDDADNGGRQ